jgi:NitT/TauT family transport system substrate-binding protein
LRFWLMAAVLVAGLAAASLAGAETDTVRIARQYSLAELPLMVAEKRKLIEKRALAAGLDQVKVEWIAPDKSGAVDTLLSGHADLAPVSIGHFLAAWDHKFGTPQDMRALAPLARVPYVLVTRNAAVKTIRDFSDRDRIAVPAVKFSGPALVLEMAAAQEWGAEHYDKLDDLVRSRADSEASAELRDGKTDLDTHFSRSPYVDDELGSNAIHRVMDSYDVAGPHTDDALLGLARFQLANPKLCTAIFGALQDADEVIRHNPGEAAEIYVSMTGDKEISVEDFTDIIGDPDVAFTVAPAGIGRLADFMVRIKRIKHHPDSWKDLFFPEAQATPGS